MPEHERPRLKRIDCDASEQIRIHWAILEEIAQPRPLDHDILNDLKAQLAPRANLSLVPK